MKEVEYLEVRLPIENILPVVCGTHDKCIILPVLQRRSYKELIRYVQKLLDILTNANLIACTTGL